MSGFGGYPNPAYSNIPYRKCPICGRPVKNFDAHVKSAGHEKLRKLHEELFNELLDEFTRSYPDMRLDSGIMSSLNEKAWVRAIEMLGGDASPVKVVAEKPPYAIREGLICPKTKQPANPSYCKARCMDCAAVGHPARPKYYVCLLLKPL